MTNRSLNLHVSRVLAIGMASIIHLGAQTGGVFRGEVRDSSNALVDKARILLRSTDTGVETIAESSSEGLYVTPSLIPGKYILTASREGFASTIFGPVTLQVNQIVRVDFSLRVGAVSESIRVPATASQLTSSESAEISQVIELKVISQVPLNGRQWQQLILLSPGVNPGSPGETGSPNSINVAGQRSKANFFSADGISTTSSAQGRTNGFNIPLEAVSEFSVQSGAYSAEYGNVAGGVINIQTKSGTNQWHGALFEFLRNDKFDATNFFSNATNQPKNTLRYNQFGGALGGPIRRDKTFIFGDYQGTISRTGIPMISSVPLAAYRAGDFSELRNSQGSLIPIYDPFGSSLARTPFPGNRIPDNRINSAARQITALLPQPNQLDSAGKPLPFNNFAVTRSIANDSHSFDLRVDHQFSSRSTAFVRYSYQQADTITPSIFGLPLGGSISLAGTSQSRAQNVGIGHIFQFTPAVINELRIGVNRPTSSLLQEDFGQNLSEQFGIPGINTSPETSGLSTMAVAGLFNVGGAILTPLKIASTAWNFNEKLIWLKGRNTIRFGFDYQDELGSNGYLVFGRGFYTFHSLTTSTAIGTPGGDAFASFLTGAPLQVSRDRFPPGMVGLSSWRLGIYVQDDIKVNSRFTLNLGSRYDIMPYARERYNRLSNFDPASRTMLLAGRDTDVRLRKTDYGNVAPRIGMAFSLNRQRTAVIRAGYGVSFVDPIGGASVLNSTQFNIPFYFRDNIDQFPFFAPQYTLTSQLPELTIPSPSSPRGDQRYLAPEDRNQYSQTWSIELQRAFTPNLFAGVAYVGTSGSRLLMTSNLNAAPPGATDRTTRRPFGSQIGEVRAFLNGAHSTYHGLQAKLQQRFAHSIYFLASYSWSKSLDNQSTGTDDSAASGQSPQNPRNFGLDRGLSSFDRAHRFVGTAVWEVPFKLPPQIRSRATEAILSGWQISGIFTANTGAPFSVLMNCATINADGNNCRPNRVSDGTLQSHERTVDHWFDKRAFSIPGQPAYGTAGRNILRGPGSINIDLMFGKSFQFAETKRVQIRSEFFNIVNHTNFGLPIHAMESPAIGTITSAAPARVIQFGMRLEF